MLKLSSGRKFTHTLLGRSILTSVVPAAMVLMGFALLAEYRRYNMLLEQEEATLYEESANLAAWMNGKNLAGMESVLTVSASQGTIFGNRTEASEMARRTLEILPWVEGVTVCYDANADGQDAQAATSAGVSEKGRFIPYWYRDRKQGGAPRLKALTGIETDEWSLLPRQRWATSQKIEALMTEPYEYEGRLMFTYTVAFTHGQKFAGVVCLDRPLDELEAEIAARAKHLQADIVVVSKNGRVISAVNGTGRTYPTDLSTWKNTALDKLSSGKTIAQVIAETVEGSGETIYDPSIRETSIWSSTKVNTGNWSVVIGVPESTITGPIIKETLFTGLFAIMITGVISAIIYVPTRAMVRRVTLAAHAAERVASGDLTHPKITTTSKDETGDLLRSIDSMTEDLNSLVRQVREASLELGTTATELSATARQQEEMVASFGASSVEVAAAVRQINATGQELSKEMEHVNNCAGATTKLAKDGRVQLEGMEGAMQSLDTATTSVADRLSAINEKAVNIGGVVTTITKVAEQTNLLSVNAAIEAEKAGEYGRGFLVVAREIRRLADQTAQATLDIERMVKEMQGAVSSGVMEMDRFSDQVRRNVADVREIGRSMTDIIVGVDESSRSFGTVREGMNSQASGAGQISEAMSALSVNAKATNQAARDFSTASDTLQRSISTLKTAIAAFQLRA